MKHGDAFIDWSTTKVAALGERQQSFVLIVEVGGFASEHWKDAFEKLIKAYNRQQKPWGNVGLGSAGPFGGARIRVDDIKPEGEADLKAQLDHLAELACEEAAPADKQDERRLAEKEARENQASALEARFRIT